MSSFVLLACLTTHFYHQRVSHFSSYLDLYLYPLRCRDIQKDKLEDHETLHVGQCVDIPVRNPVRKNC